MAGDPSKRETAVQTQHLPGFCLPARVLPVRPDYLWVALAVIGLSLLLPITPSTTALDTAGVLYALAAGVGWALYIVFGQKAGRPRPLARS
jgi:threonine/homoserine efflux transporter RhtA